MYKKYLPLLITNFLGVLNDNFLKTLACFVAIRWVEPQYASLVVSAAAGALVLPYLFFSPLAGVWSERHSRPRIVRWAKVAEIPIMGVAVAGFVAQNVWVVILSIVLMGLQSALFSPAKYALVRDVGGMEHVSQGMGAMEAVSFLGMLSGMLTASFLVDVVDETVIHGLLLAIAGLGLCASLTIRSGVRYAGDATVESVNPITFLKQTFRRADQYKGLNPIIFTLSVFWWLAASLQIGLLIYCGQTLGLNSIHTGLVLSMAALGITVGCLVSGIVHQNRYVLSGVVFTAWGMSVVLFVLFFWATMPVWLFGVLVFVLAFLAGCFKVPLDTAIQRMAKGDFLSVVLAYLNQVSFVFILLASATFSAITWFLEPGYLFFVLGIVFVVTPFYLMGRINELTLWTGNRLLSLRYRVEIRGLEHLRTRATYLILPNHQAVVDPMLLYSSLHELPIAPLVDEDYFSVPVVGRTLRGFGAISVPNITPSSRQGIEQAAALERLTVEALAEGRNILFYPSGRITYTRGEKIGNKQLAYQVCRQLPEGVEVIGVRIRGLWGSIWSRRGRKNTPPLLPTLLRGVVLFVFGLLVFRRRRRVTITLEPITEQVRQWSALGDKRAFNAQLEAYYNQTIKKKRI